jgi:hypothetical protein
MKSLFALLLCSLIILPGAYSQCSNPYYQIRQGTVMVMENYNDKGKLEGKSETTVVKFNESSSGYEATIAYKLYDKKDKLSAEGEYEFECDNGTIKMDMSGFVPAQSMEAFESMEVEIKMDHLEYPSELSVGQTLKDGHFELTTSNSPMAMNFVFDMVDRKVEGKETITTPAGTFDCYKIGYTTKSKMMITNMEFRNVQYMAEKCGAVKTEMYKSNGNLMGYTLLTKYEY